MTSPEPLSLTVTASQAAPPAAATAPPDPFWAAATGPEGCPQGWMPGPVSMTAAERGHALNPLQYVPGAGMIYRAITGEDIPAPLKIAGAVATSAIAGGPLGALGSIVLNFVEELVRLGPDRSRPALPEGFAPGGSESGVTPVTPGTITTPGAYTTLATTVPDFLARPATDAASQAALQRGQAAYEWQRTLLLEHGVT